ncbi:hypothetical protein PQR65_05240 [Paraburkholderia nemoris]|uniref:hypothetical protein n=1 Tax=Paraburkholderia nemoris TaxID=2793076 RepID=UPI0038BB27B5
MSGEPTHLPEVAIERMLTLELWLHENRRMRSIWRFGSPHLTGPDNMARWLKRHEKRLAERGAVLRLGNAWRIIEPVFQPAMFEILGEERDAAMRRKEQKC